MLSITDLLDFPDLDEETIHIVSKATRLSVAESVTLARQFLATEKGLVILHHMFRDEIVDAVAKVQWSREADLRRAYKQFSRKYPVPCLGANTPARRQSGHDGAANA